MDAYDPERVRGVPGLVEELRRRDGSEAPRTVVRPQFFGRLGTKEQTGPTA